MTKPATIPNFLLYGESSSDSPAQISHIETIAARSVMYDWEITPHRHAHCMQLLLVSRGQVAFRRDHLSGTLDGPCFVFVPVDCVHGFRFVPDTEGYVLSFSSELVARCQGSADPMRELITHGGHGVIAPAAADRVRWLCAELLATMQDWRTPQPFFLALAEALVRSLIPEHRTTPQGDVPLHEERLARFRQLVEVHLREHRAVEWYAGQLAMSVRGLSRLCRAVLDRSPQEVIHGRLALEAKRLLTFTNANVVQVAEELGFADPSYFSRFYLRMTGRRPVLEKRGSD
ncbi:helix-turn-helix domain-containing protein [Novosphingobium sp. BL-52-GroH]|uniref:helix-turn-helix domain-containing protein n=1 Tax=Novosphingobium sp. BL-52-GroH TaxID=3349877 RepID=UPI00384F70E8